MPRSAPSRSAPSRSRASAAFAAAVLAGTVTVSGLAVAAPAGAAPVTGVASALQGQEGDRVKITGVPVGSTLDGVRIDGSVERLARGDARARRETFHPRATAAPATAYQMPFPCGESWVGTTRSSHSPSVLSVDWNATDDFDKPVVASAAGTVLTASSGGSGYGRYVVIDHGNGDSTLYAHLNSVGVRVGQEVEQGQQVGRLGTTGNSTGPHLHYEQRSGGSVVHPYFDGVRFTFNTTLTSQNCEEEPTPVLSDVALAADVVDDEADEPVRWRPADGASFEARRLDGTTRVITMGAAGDIPVLGRWNGTGKANPGVWNPETRVFRLRSPQGRQEFRFGLRGNLPVAGDWDGDGTDEVGVWRPGAGRFDLRGRDGTIVRSIVFGERGQLPLIGDWNGDGKADVGTYDPITQTFTIRFPKGRTKSFVFGPEGAQPIAGDWDGDGRSQVGTYDPATGEFALRRR